jgi:mono/diheme cytochrome c family protein
VAKRWLKRLLKIAGYGFLGLLVLLAGVITFTIGWRPIFGAKARALTDRKFERTPQRLERGRYLVEGVTLCFGCHSTYDRSTAEIPALVGHKGGGGTFAQEGMPWLTAPNITPDAETGVGSWSDDALARAIREGISLDGRALFPLMPYQAYSRMSDEDLASVITYLRSIEPARNQLPKTNMPFPLSRLVNTVPEPLTAPVPEPDVTDTVRRGEYLVIVGDCAGCHTPRGKTGAPLAGLDYGGGTVFGPVAASNITPDASGITYYDEAIFVDMIRTGQVKARKINTAMPWWLYRNMTDEDLKAVFAYLRTLKPVKHRLDNAVAPSECKLCGQKHGLGETN